MAPINIATTITSINIPPKNIINKKFCKKTRKES